jgi:MYXO-CTERM domain-containing protein
MIRKLTRIFVPLSLLVASSAALADSNPFHNPRNAYDVDNNNRVAPRDFLLIVNEIQRQSSPQVTPLAASDTSYYWDTSNDFRITPRDALLVANHLTAVTPEPSSVISGGVGLLALAGYAWRRRKRRKMAR